MISRRPPPFGPPSGAEAAKPSVATSERINRLLEALLGEIRPQLVDEHQLSICPAPQQEVAEPDLAAGSNDKIRIGRIRRPDHPRDHRLIDLVRPQPASGDHPAHLAHRRNQLAAPAIVKGDVQRQTHVVPRRAHRIVDQLEQVLAQPLARADDPDPHAVPVQLRQIPLHEHAQEIEQRIDL
jgi:hypothetical protein